MAQTNPQTLSCNEQSITLYTTVLDLAKNEISVIWTRYSAFLVVIGFLVAATTQTGVDPLIQFASYIIGILTCIIWFMMNFFGWHNQNYYLLKAYKLVETDEKFKHIHNTLHFPIEIKKPHGQIYILAQLIPFILYIFFETLLIKKMKTEFNCTVPNIILAIVIILSILLYINSFNKKPEHTIA